MAVTLKLALLLFASVVGRFVSGADAPTPGGSDASIGISDALIQDEVEALSVLADVKKQLGLALSRLPHDGESDEIDVVVSESEGSGSNISDEWIDEEIVVDIAAASGSGPRLTEDEKTQVEEQVMGEVAQTIDQVLVDEVLEDTAVTDPTSAVAQPVEQETGGSVGPGVQALVEKEQEAFDELVDLGEQLDTALQTLPTDGEAAEIDVVIGKSDDSSSSEQEDEEVEGEIVLEIAASSGSGPRFTDEVREALEEEVVDQVADVLDATLVDEFFQVTGVPEPAPSIQDTPERAATALPKEKVVNPSWEEKEPSPALRGNAEAFDEVFADVPTLSHRRHWELPPDDELWPVKLSLLTAVSSVALLLVVAVGAQVRRSRRHSYMAHRQLEWAEAVEILDAFPEDT